MVRSHRRQAPEGSCGARWGNFEPDPRGVASGSHRGLVRPSLDSVFRVPQSVAVGGLLVWL
jgi:hypothetical protein